MKKLSIICFSGDFDRAVAAFTLAAGAAAVNHEVNLFFTFWGLNIIKRRPRRAFIGRGVLARVFNYLAGGVRNLPMSRLNFLGISPSIMTHLMKRRNVATLAQLVEAALAVKVNFYVCEMSMNIFGMDTEDFIPAVKEVVGVAGFLEISEGGRTLFI